MSGAFPGAVPELRVSDVARSAVYFEKCLGEGARISRQSAGPRARP